MAELVFITVLVVLLIWLHRGGYLRRVSPPAWPIPGNALGGGTTTPGASPPGPISRGTSVPGTTVPGGPTRGTATPAGQPRFRGIGIVDAASVTPAPIRPTATPRGRVARRSTPPARLFNGRVQHNDDAIGLACLRPISECKLGANCLCRD